MSEERNLGEAGGDKKKRRRIPYKVRSRLRSRLRSMAVALVQSTLIRHVCAKYLHTLGQGESKKQRSESSSSQPQKTYVHYQDPLRPSLEYG